MRLYKSIDGICSGASAEKTGRLKERREFGSDSEYAIYQAKVFYEVFGNNAKAALLLEDALSRDDRATEDLYISLGEVYSRFPEDPEKVSRGFDMCRKALEIDPESDDAYTIMARLHHIKGEFVECYLSAEKALKINLDNYEALLYHGSLGFAIAHQAGDIEEMQLSLENLRIAQKYYPESTRLEKIIAEDTAILEGLK